MSADRLYKFRQSIGECLTGDSKWAQSDSDKSRLKCHTTGYDTRCGSNTSCGIKEFNDDTLDLRDDAYDQTEKKKEVNDVALNRFISRILFSASMNEDDEDHYGMCEYHYQI